MKAIELWAKIEILIKQFEAYCTVMDTISVHEDFQLWKTLQARKIAIVEEKRALAEQWKAAIYAERLAAVTLPKTQPVTAQSVTNDVTCKYCNQNIGMCGCDYCELEGHNWIEMSGYRACLTCGIEEDVASPVSWRQQIVEEAIREDAQNGR